MKKIIFLLFLFLLVFYSCQNTEQGNSVDPILTVSNLTALELDRKVWLEWDNPVTNAIYQIVVYVTLDGEEIDSVKLRSYDPYSRIPNYATFSGLENGKEYIFMVVVMDAWGNPYPGKWVAATPMAEVESDKQYRIVKAGSSITQPSWYTLYFQVKDEDGMVVDIFSVDDFSVTYPYSHYSAIESVFEFNKSDLEPEKVYNVVLIDNSFSMVDNLDEIKSGLFQMLDHVDDNETGTDLSTGKMYFQLCSVSKEVERLHPNFSNDLNTLKSALNQLELGYNISNLESGILNALGFWEDSWEGEKISFGNLLVISDFYSTDGLYLSSYTDFSQKRVFSLGIEGSKGLNDDNMEYVGKTGSFTLGELDSLSEKLIEIEDTVQLASENLYKICFMYSDIGRSSTVVIDVKNNSQVEELEADLNFTQYYPVKAGIYVNDDKINPEGFHSRVLPEGGDWEINLHSYFTESGDLAAFPEYNVYLENGLAFQLTEDTEDNSKYTINASGSLGQADTLIIEDTVNSLQKEIALEIGPPFYYFDFEDVRVDEIFQGFWSLDSSVARGNISLRSAPQQFSNSAKNEVLLDLPYACQFSFYLRSELDYRDEVKMYINDTLFASICEGYCDWYKVETALAAGVYRIKFNISKDRYSDKPDACFWIDDVSLQ